MAKTSDFDSAETIMVESHSLSCDGGGGALGHPLVWYEIGDEGVVVCKYCERRFMLRGGKADPAA